MPPDPVEVAILVAGIDHQQVSAVRHRIDEDIIDDAARLVAEHGVLDPTRPQPREVTRDHALGETLVFDTQCYSSVLLAQLGTPIEQLIP